MTGVKYLALPVVIREKAHFRTFNRGMTNEIETVQMNETKEQMSDVQWLDEVALHKAVIAGDPEAFAEMIRRFDPRVRDQLSRAIAEERIEEAMAEFWIVLIRDPQLREWDPELGGVLGQHLGALATQVARAQERRAA